MNKNNLLLKISKILVIIVLALMVVQFYSSLFLEKYIEASFTLLILVILWVSYVISNKLDKLERRNEE